MGLIQEFAQLFDQQQKKSAHNPSAQLSLSLNPMELDDLPDELINELSVSKADKVEYLILTALDKQGGFASLDRLLVAIYKDGGVILKRTVLNNRLYRMASKGLIYSVPDKKGVYSLTPFRAGEIDKILLAARASREGGWKRRLIGSGSICFEPTRVFAYPPDRKRLFLRRQAE